MSSPSQEVQWRSARDHDTAINQDYRNEDLRSTTTERAGRAAVGLNVLSGFTCASFALPERLLSLPFGVPHLVGWLESTCSFSSSITTLRLK